MKSNLKLILSGLFSFLGLVSCNSNDPQIHHEKDPWTLEEPTLRSSEGHQEPLLAAVRSTVPVDSEIQFGSDNLKEITISSRCEHNLAISNLTQTVRNRSVVPIRSLIPVEAIGHNQYDPKGIVTCHFDFNVKNSVGSSHKFSLPSVKIASLERLDDLTFFSPQSENPSEEGVELSSGPISPHSLADARAVFSDRLTSHFSTQSQEDISRSIDLPMHAQMTAKLVCERFSHSVLLHARDLSDPRSSKEQLTALFWGPLSEVKSSGADPRRIHTEQKCRVLLYTSESESGLHYFWQSRVFDIQFPPPQPKIQGRMGLSDFTFKLSENDGSSFSQGIVFEISIINDQPVPLGFRFPQDHARSLELQTVFITRENTFFASIPFSEKLHIEVIGASRFFPHHGDFVFEVASGTEVIVRAKLNTITACPIMDEIGIAVEQTVSPHSFIGFGYRYTKPFRLEQFRSWDPTQPNTQGPTVDRTPIPMPLTESGQVFPGWIPHRRWLAIHSAGWERPENISYAPGRAWICVLEGKHNFLGDQHRTMR